MSTPYSAVLDVLLRLESWFAIRHRLDGNISRLEELTHAVNGWEPAGMNDLALADRCMEWIDDVS